MFTVELNLLIVITHHISIEYKKDSDSMSAIMISNKIPFHAAILPIFIYQFKVSN